MGAACRDIGLTCAYPDVTCVCRKVPYCPGGAARPGPPPPPESVELECMAPECVGATPGEACSHEGAECRGPVCDSRLECRSRRWNLVELGPPP
jgi:hypothetical protein